MHVGVGLWTMQSTAASPGGWPDLYGRVPEQATLLEDVGIDSMWFAEHRGWYDGYCPSPLTAIAAAAGTTSTLRLGTAMALGPQHDPRRLAGVAAALDRLSGGRLELGIGLGHRDAEFDMVGVPRHRRGRRMEALLDRIAESGGIDTDRIWGGALARPGLERIGRRGLSALLPQTLYPDELASTVTTIRAAGPAGRIGVLKDVHVAGDGAAARSWFEPRLHHHYSEEAGAWWLLAGEDGPVNGFGAPEGLARQLSRITDTAVVGDPDEVAGELLALRDGGVDTVVARLNFDFLDPVRLESTVRLFAADVAPALKEEP